MSDHPVPSTHYQSVNGDMIPIPTHKEDIAMSEITENNPFPIKKEEEPMKLSVKHSDGTIMEYDLSILSKPKEEMSNMDIVLGWIKATEAKHFLESNMSVMTNRSEMGRMTFNPRWQTFIDVDDQVLDALNVIDKFFERDAEEENYNPSCMYSWRMLTEKFSRYEKNGQKPGSVQITEMLVRDMGGLGIDENKKHRVIIEFRTYAASTSGSHYQKRWPYGLMITRTPDGLRAMWVKLRGKKGHKFVFGQSYVQMARKGFVPGSNSRMDKDAQVIALRLHEYLMNTTSFGDWLPIAKYMENARPSYVDINKIHPYNITQSDIYWIGGSTDVKEIVNKAYGKTGVEGVTKKMFGGRNNIKDLANLRTAIVLARCLRDFPNTVFNDMNIVAWQSYLDLMVDPNVVRQFFQKFGAREHYLFTKIDEIGGEVTLGVPRLYDAYDAMRMFKLIRNKAMRQAIVNHVRNHKMTIEQVHDFISAELLKVQTENQPIPTTKFRKLCKSFDQKWIADGVQMVYANETHDLVEWGATQNNCIGSMGVGYVMNHGSTIIGFKDKEGNWIGHAEIREGHLVQLLGKNNRPLEAEVRSKIAKFMQTELNVDIPPHYMGNR